MNFAQFQQAREMILRERPDVRDCAATNLYAALARHNPRNTAAAEAQIHRCHLATQWADYFGFPKEAARRALISSGVRDALALLFKHYAAQGAQLWLPTDNYPVYGQLANAAGLSSRGFPTLPEPAWPQDPAGDMAEVLLITNPLKPLGRWLSDWDVATLCAWLGADPRRRLLIDAVYTFEDRFHDSTLRLLATGQTLLLHSLTKGWLHPRCFGITLVPEADAAALAPIFRENPPPQPNLARARELMSAFGALPKTIARELQGAGARLRAILPEHLRCVADNDATGYFLAVAGPWERHLNESGILGLPATAFGSMRDDITILTSLTFLE